MPLLHHAENIKNYFYTNCYQKIRRRIARNREAEGKSISRFQYYQVKPFFPHSLQNVLFHCTLIKSIVHSISFLIKCPLFGLFFTFWIYILATFAHWFHVLLWVFCWQNSLRYVTRKHPCVCNSRCFKLFHDWWYNESTFSVCAATCSSPTVNIYTHYHPLRF